MQKRADMGIGTLVIFISLMLVAAIAAGVLIQTSSSLQEKSLMTGDETRSQISTNLKVVDITIEKDSDDEYKDMMMIIKQAPGSEAVKLENLMLSNSLHDTSVTLLYRGIGCTLDNSDTGYQTSAPQELGGMGVYTSVPTGPIGMLWRSIPVVDYDLDGQADYNKICCDGPNKCPDSSKNQGPGEDGWMAINMSTAGIEYVRVTTAADVPIPLCSASAVADVDMAAVGEYGYISINGNVGSGSITNTAVVYYLKETPLYSDMDQDGNTSDYAYVNTTHLIFFWSDGTTDAISLGADISTPQTLSVADAPIGDAGSKGRVTISGTTTRNYYIDEDVTLSVEPVSNGGYYAVEYLQEATNSREGVIMSGDVVRLYFQLPRAISDEERIYLALIPKSGIPTRVEVYSPNVMSENQISLYP